MKDFSKKEQHSREDYLKMLGVTFVNFHPYFIVLGWLKFLLMDIYKMIASFSICFISVIQKVSSKTFTTSAF